MKVRIKVTEVQDSIELEYFLKDLRKLREKVYSTTDPSFTVEIHSKFPV